MQQAFLEALRSASDSNVNIRNPCVKLLIVIRKSWENMTPGGGEKPYALEFQGAG